MYVYFTHNYRRSVYQLHVVDDDELPNLEQKVKNNVVEDNYIYLAEYNTEGYKYLITAEEYYEKELENEYSDESPELVDYNFAKPNEKLSQDILYYSKHEAFVHIVNTDYKYLKSHREWELPHHLDECVSVVYYKNLN